jgi:hypothetical protein
LINTLRNQPEMALPSTFGVFLEEMSSINPPYMSVPRSIQF